MIARDGAKAVIVIVVGDRDGVISYADVLLTITDFGPAKMYLGVLLLSSFVIGRHMRARWTMFDT